MKNNVRAIYCGELSRRKDKRYVVINADTGEIVTDANGYGYKSIARAYAGYNRMLSDKDGRNEKRM